MALGATDVSVPGRRSMMARPNRRTQPIVASPQQRLHKPIQVPMKVHRAGKVFVGESDPARAVHPRAPDVMGTPGPYIWALQKRKVDAAVTALACVLQLAITACTSLPASGDGPAQKLETRGDDCVSCHADEWSGTAAPSHTQFGFDQDCGGCHEEKDWSPAQGYAHVASFPLALGHANRACASCHTTPNGFEPSAAVNDCAACHAARAAAVPSPIHAGLSQNCFACHKTEAFKPSRFVHSWPLQGVHETLPCVSCHSGRPAQYEGTSTFCVRCHADDRARADMTIGGHSGFSNSCETCHGFGSFKVN
jgi:predicted CXXCH cytochrome family protein